MGWSVLGALNYPNAHLCKTASCCISIRGTKGEAPRVFACLTCHRVACMTGQLLKLKRQMHCGSLPFPYSCRRMHELTTDTHMWRIQGARSLEEQELRSCLDLFSPGTPSRASVCWAGQGVFA